MSHSSSPYVNGQRCARLSFLVTLVIAVLTAETHVPDQVAPVELNEAMLWVGNTSTSGCHNLSLCDEECDEDESSQNSTSNSGGDGQAQQPESSSLSRKGSVIDRAGFNHWHIAMDWQVQNPVAGCKPCGKAGGASAPKSLLPGLQVRRVHRYREEFLYWSSLGPGVFLDWDQVIQFYGGNNGITAIFYDVDNARHEIWKEKVSYRNDSSIDGVLWNRHLNVAGAMRLYSDANWSVPTSDVSDLTTATIQGHDGSMAYFEVFTNCPADPNNTQFGLTKVGRLARFEDSNGNALVVDHVYPVTTSRADCRDYWKISTVTDAHNRQASFTYKSGEVGGRFVVERIDLPDGTHLTYHYDSQYLTGVTLGNGEVVSITKGFDATTQCATISYDDPACRGTHRRKTAHLTTATWTNPEDPADVRNQAVDRLRLLVNGEDEVAYMAWDGGAAAEAFCYEGGVGLTHLRWEPFADFDGRPKAAKVATSWDLSQDVSTYTWETRSSYQTGVDPIRVSKRTDNLSREWSYGWDKQRQKVSQTTYPDGSTANWTYNDFRKVVDHTDRLGRITHHSYDGNGNLLSRTKAYGTADAATEYFTYRPSTGQLETYTDFNGNTTTYIYDSNNFLAEVRQPKDHPADASRPTTLYEFDAVGRLISVTDPEGRQTRYESSPGVPGYDARNRLTHVTYYDGSQEITAYGTGSLANLVVSTIDRNGIETRFDYDGHGRLASVTTAYGRLEAAVRTFTYLSGTDLTATVTDKGEVTRFVYDYDNRAIGTVRQANVHRDLATLSLFDASKRLVGTIDPYGRHSYFVFDVNDRLTRTVKENYAGSVAAALGIGAAQPTQLELADLARDVDTNAGYIITDIIFDAEGQAVRQIDGRGVVNAQDFDNQGRVTDTWEAMATVPPTATTTQLAILDDSDPEYVYSPVADSQLIARTNYSHDGQGNILLIKHPRYFGGHFDGTGFGTKLGCQTKMEYTGRNLLAKRIEAYQDPQLEAEEHFTYYKDGLPRTRTDFRGKVWVTHHHACCGRFQAETDPTGSMRISNTDYMGNVTHTAVVANGLLTPSDDAPGDLANPPYPWHDPSDGDTVNETTSRYDGRGRLTHTTRWFDAQGFINDHGRANLPAPNDSVIPIAGENGVPDSAGLTSRLEYDDDLTDNAGLNPAYNAYFALLDLGPGSDGYAVANTNPAGETAVTAYDGVGRVVLTIDAEGHAIQTIYDQEVINGSGNAVVQITRLVDPDRSGYSGLKLNNHRQIDGSNRTLTTIDALHHASQFGYDANGNTLSSSDPLGVGEACVFDLRNRRIICVDTYEDATFTVYDVDGHVVQTVDGQGIAAIGGADLATYHNNSPFVQGNLGVDSCQFDARGRQVSCIDRVQGVTMYTYDANNNLKSMEDADSEGGDGITRYAYDDRNLLIREEFPGHVANTDPGEAGNDARVYTYDAAQRLVRRRDQNGDDIVYQFDFADRLVSRVYPDHQSDVFTHDGADRVLTASSARYAVDSSRSFYPDGRLATETLSLDGQSYTVSYSYDAANRQVGVLYPADPDNGGDDLQLERFFTARSQLQRLRFDGEWVAGDGGSDGFEYAHNRRESRRRYANGVVTDFDYRQSGSKRDNLVASIRSHHSGSDVSHFSYQYDANKRKTDEDDLVSSAYSQDFVYDAGDRLTSWQRSGASGVLPQSQGWTLSAVGDWQQSILDQGLGTERIDDRSHSAVHEVVSTTQPKVAGRTALRHDAKGNLTYDARRDQTYDYDYDNRLQRAFNPELSDPLARLEARWVFDGSTVDVNNDHDGSLTGGSLPVADGRHGSGALRFTGNSGHRVVIPDDAAINTGIHGQRTVMLWFKLASGAKNGSGKQVLYEEGGGSRGFNIYISGGQLYVGGWNNVAGESGWSGTYHSTSAFSEQTWHHVAFVLDGTALVQPTAFKAYLDGQLFGVGPGSQLWSHGDDTGIGGLAGGSKWHDGTSSSGVRSVDGWIDECALYNVALGPAALYQAAERAVVSYDLNSASGSTVSNQAIQTGSSLNGSLQNGAQVSAVAGYRQSGLDSTSTNSARILIPNDNTLNLQTQSKRTVALRFKLERGALAASAGSTGNYQVLFEEGGGTRGLNIYLGDGRLYIGGWNKPSNESNWAGSFISTDQLGENRWHHVALVLDGSATTQADALTAYLDGAVIGTASGSQLWPHSGNITVGAAGGGTIFHDGSATGVSLDGSIDDVLLSNDAVDAATIADLAATSCYRYDAFGRRVAKRVGASQRVFLCGDSQVLSEYVDGELDRSYVSGSYVDEPIVMQTATGDRYYYSRNHLYSVSAVTDGSGAVVQRNHYAAHGDRLVSAQGLLQQDYGFTGRRFDDELGIWYFRSRYFDAQLGRFLKRDTAPASKLEDVSPNAGDGYHDGKSLYQAYFIPNHTDPTGHKCEAEKQALDEALEALDDRGPGNRPPGRLKRQRYARAVRNLRKCLYGDNYLPHGYSTCTGVSDTPAGFDFSSCCFSHDKCYGKCKTSLTPLNKEPCCGEYLLKDVYNYRLGCDQDFKACMMGKCASQSWSAISRRHCEAQANKYFIGVRAFGYIFFGCKACDPHKGKK